MNGKSLRSIDRRVAGETTGGKIDSAMLVQLAVPQINFRWGRGVQGITSVPETHTRAPSLLALGRVAAVGLREGARKEKERNREREREKEKLTPDDAEADKSGSDKRPRSARPTVSDFPR